MVKKGKLQLCVLSTVKSGRKQKRVKIVLLFLNHAEQTSTVFYWLVKDCLIIPHYATRKTGKLVWHMDNPNKIGALLARKKGRLGTRYWVLGSQ